MPPKHCCCYTAAVHGELRLICLSENTRRLGGTGVWGSVEGNTCLLQKFSEANDEQALSKYKKRRVGDSDTCSVYTLRVQSSA